MDGFLGAAHVASLGDELDSGFDQGLGLVAGDLILSGRRKSHIRLTDVGPGSDAINVFGLGLEALHLRQLRQLFASLLESHDLLDMLRTHALFIDGDDGAFAIREGHDRPAELDHLEGRILGHIAGTADDDPFAFEGLLAPRGMFDHMVDVLGLDQ